MKPTSDIAANDQDKTVGVNLPADEKPLGPIGVMVISSSGHLLAVSEPATEMLGIDSKDSRISGEDSEEPVHLFDLLPESQHPRWQHMLAAAAISREDCTVSELPDPTNKSNKCLRLHFCRVSFQGAGDAGLVITVQETNCRASDAKPEGLATETATEVAHELNNLLGIVNTNTELFGMNVNREAWERAQANAHAVGDQMLKIKDLVARLVGLAQKQ